MVKTGGFPCLGEVSMGAGSGGGCRDRELERGGRTLEAWDLDNCNISVVGNAERRTGVTKGSIWEKGPGELRHQQ